MVYKVKEADLPEGLTSPVTSRTSDAIGMIKTRPEYPCRSERIGRVPVVRGMVGRDPRTRTREGVRIPLDRSVMLFASSDRIRTITWKGKRGRLPFNVRVSTPDLESRWHWISLFERQAEKVVVKLSDDRSKAFRFVSKEEATVASDYITGMKTRIVAAQDNRPENTPEPVARFSEETSGWLPLENVAVALSQNQISVGRLIQFGEELSVVAFVRRTEDNRQVWNETSVKTAQMRKVRDKHNERLRGMA